jgi:flagellar protein FlaG
MVSHIPDAKTLREIGTAQNRAQTPPASPATQNSQTDLPPEQKVQAMQAAVEKLIRSSVPANTKLVIDQDKKSGTYIYRSVDPKTGKTVSQWPAEAILKLRDSLSDMEGMLVDHKV